MSDCPFCKRIAAGQYSISDRFAVAFEPLNPVTHGHLLVVPRQHVADAGSSPLAASRTMSLAAEIAGPLAWADSYNLITSAGAAATQSVRHLHVHLVPRHAGDGLALPWTGQQRAQLDPGSPSGSPGLSQDTREGQERTDDPGASGEALGVILAAARSRLGWSLRDTERTTGIPNAHLSQIETGKIASPAIVVLVKLAKAYGMPLRRLIEAAGQGSDWVLVEEASEAEIRAAERERIAQLAEERMATYDLTKPCGCGRTNPYTGRPCTALIRSGQPFADLIREADDG